MMNTHEPAIPRQAARMKDIAREAGVSVPTVSRALMGSDRVKPDTRQKVEAAAAKLGYTLNHIARSLRTQRTHLVVVIVPDIGNTFFSYVLGGIEEEAQRHGYSVLFGNVAGDMRRAKSYGDRLLSGAADGVIFLDGQLPEPGWLEKVQDLGLPIVALCERMPGIDVHTVTIDNEAAAYAATRHLIEAGHAIVAHIAGPDGNILSEDRIGGYRRAIVEACLAQHDSLIVGGDFTISGGYRAFNQVWADHPGVTAVFCANDEMAIGCINAMRDHGLSAPKDVAVIGFDGLEFGEAYYPPLSTVVQPRSELGATAMRVLLSQIEGRPAKRQQILPFELAIRMSSVSRDLFRSSS